MKLSNLKGFLFWHFSMLTPPHYLWPIFQQFVDHKKMKIKIKMKNTASLKGYVVILQTSFHDPNFWIQTKSASLQNFS